MCRTVFTLALVFAVCLFADAQQPALPGGPLPDPVVKRPADPVPPPPLKPAVEPDPLVRRLNEEEDQIRSKQEELKQRLAAIAVEKEQAKKRPVGKIEATVEGFLYDLDKPRPYILCRYPDQAEFRVYLQGFADGRFTLERETLAGKLVRATGRLVPGAPERKAAGPALPPLSALPALPGALVDPPAPLPLVLETARLEEVPSKPAPPISLPLPSK